MSFIETLQRVFTFITLFILWGAAESNRKIKPYIDDINEKNKNNYHKPIIPTPAYTSLIIAAILQFVLLVFTFINN